MRVRAEDVLNDPDSQLRAIAAWLGIRTDDGAIDAMKHAEASPFAGMGLVESGVVGGNDPIFLRDPVPHGVNVPRTLDPPQGWTADASTWKMVVDLANRLGYFDYEGNSTPDALDKR